MFIKDMDLNIRLKVIRALKRWSEGDLAKAIKISVSTLSRYKEENEPSMSIITKARIKELEKEVFGEVFLK